MKWTVRLVAEPRPGESFEHEGATIEREDLVSPAAVGLSIAEAKAIMENLQLIHLQIAAKTGVGAVDLVS